MGLIRMIQGFWQAQKMKSELRNTKLEIDKLKQKSEGEKILDSELANAAKELVQQKRELDKLVKLKETERQINNYKDSIDDAYDENTDEEEEESDPISKAAEQAFGKILGNVLGAPNLSKPPASMPVENATEDIFIERVKKLSPEMKKVLIQYADAYGI